MQYERRPNIFSRQDWYEEMYIEEWEDIFDEEDLRWERIFDRIDHILQAKEKENEQRNHAI